ncbi:MAG: cell division protein FtsK [Leptolyngbya sp. PLA3]|nr:MAG: cell division protein FtsK [Cyanobacteria bacterium CYA]MCE7969008.1 cell division protein FtsK [Leptolyngbya sp. PL-A3]
MTRMTTLQEPITVEHLMHGPFARRQHALITLFQQTIAEFAAESTLLERRISEQTEQAERECRHRRHKAQQESESRLKELNEKRERTLTRLSERFYQTHTEAQRAYERERLGLIEKLNNEQLAADEKLKEQAWLAETVYDAAEAKPRLTYDRVARGIETLRKQASELDQAARHFAQSAANGIGPPTPAIPALPPVDAEECLAHVKLVIDEATLRLVRLQRAGLLKGFRMMLFVTPLVGLGGGVAGGALTNWTQWLTPVLAGAGTFGAVALLLIPMRLLGLAQLRRRYCPIIEQTATVRGLCDAIDQRAAAARDAESRALLERKRSDLQRASATHAKRREIIEQRRRDDVAGIDQRHKPALEAMKRQHAEELAQVTAQADEQLAQFEAEDAERSSRIESDYAARLSDIGAQHRLERDRLDQTWFERHAMIRAAAEDMEDRAATLFPEWSDGRWREYHPPAAAPTAIMFGHMVADAASFKGGLPPDQRLLEGVRTRYDLPAMMDFPGRCSLLLECGPAQRDAAIATLQNTMLRLLTSIPPGKLRFTIIDPVGLGQSFAGYMHLADFEEALVTNRIWTDPKHIEQRLTDLTEHMEKVIQKYLRNEFESIEAYNVSAGEIAEPYRFLVIADFPTAFTDTAAQRLKSILESGARCGVYTLMLVDPATKLPSAIKIDDLERHAVTVLETEDGLRMAGEPLNELPLTLEAPPSDEFLSRTVRRVGELSKDAGRVEVPFRKITPAAGDLWSEDCSRELRVPLGRAGATKLQYMELGRGTSQHVLIAGKTGSGKSTLLHVLISSLAMWYSPRQVEFYLVDFKKGVEFKTYATHRLAHARAVAVESDREFGLSVLHRLDDELKRRGDLFREAGTAEIGAFREKRPDVHMPRTLLIIDEFQEFFVEDDKIAQDASLLLDRLVRQGRAFGMHVLLGSQTLSGAYSLARSTMGQMAVRIALQCSETDSYIILSEDNAAARLLARPGEAIYNDANGMIEGNSPFQIAWLPDKVRDQALEQVQDRVAGDHYQPPQPQIVFEGNVPARLEENHLLAAALREPTRIMPAAARAWLGDPVAIKEPTSAAFRRHTGSNCLLVGQQDDPALALCAAAMLSLAAQHPRNAARFVIIDGTPADDPRFGTLKSIAAALPQQSVVGSWRDADALLAEVAADLRTREEQNLTDELGVFLFIHGLHRFRSLRRKEDDFSFNADPDAPVSPDKHLASIIREGPGLGIHAFIWSDTVGNLERALDRPTIGEFDTRVLFQMNAADSTTLIDSPAAGKLGMQRALLYNEESGTLEKFRPYSLPGQDWLAEFAQALRR